MATGQSDASVVELADGLGDEVAAVAVSLTAFVVSSAALDAVAVVFLTVSVTLPVVSLTVSDVLLSVVSLVALAEAEADGVGLAVALAVESVPPVKMPVIASPMVPSRSPPLLADADGAVVAVSPPPLLCAGLLADGVGVDPALSPEPESGEEVLSGDADALAEGVASGLSADAEALAEEEAEEAEAEGVGSADVPLPSTASTHFWYSSAVRLLEDEWSSAWASVGVNPIPMRTAVGIAAMATAFPAGTWNLVNSGFLGAAWRGPVLTRDSSTSVPRVTSSAGTVPPVRPVGGAHS